MIKDLLLIDNNDSFTYNIVDLIRKIEDVNLCVRNTYDVNLNALNNYSKIIISPGPGLPSDFPNLLQIIDKIAGKIPILGICLGHQAIAQYLGARLKQIFPVVHGQAHKINIIKLSPLFDNIPLSFNVGLYHSWAIDFENIPSNINVTAVSENNIIMAIEFQKMNLFGIQFHPESHLSEYGLTVIKNFIHYNTD